MDVMKIVTGNPVFDEFYTMNKSIMLKGRKILPAEEKEVVAYVPSDGPSCAWIGGYPWRMKGFKYWDENPKSFVDYLFEKQLDNGEIFDYINLERSGKIYCYKVDNESSFAESSMVEMTYRIWQATGDDDWMALHLNQLEKAINYVTSSLRRWSKKHSLVKRPFTIDTWDFEYLEDGDSKGSAFVKQIAKDGFIMRKIDERTKFCIMHGDNSGVYQACRLLSKMFGYQNNIEKKEYWNRKAEDIRVNTNKVCWNSKFYTHQVHIDPVDISGVDESKQLSMSNVYDINRGLPSHRQAVSIIKEYQKRRKTVDSFAEWFSIDPSFPDGTFGISGWGNKAGEYVNGGIMPLVGGELARACFEHGFEEYGLDILTRYEKMIRETGECYMWYYRDGRPGRSSKKTVGSNTMAPGAMLGAFMEGLVGITDDLKLLQKVKLSPRWAATDRKDVEVKIGYAASGASFGYKYHIDKEAILIESNGVAKEIVYHVLLPKGTKAKEVWQGKNGIKFANQKIEESSYVNFESDASDKKVKIIF